MVQPKWVGEVTRGGLRERLGACVGVSTSTVLTCKHVVVGPGKSFVDEPAQAIRDALRVEIDGRAYAVRSWLWGDGGVDCVRLDLAIGNGAPGVEHVTLAKPFSMGFRLPYQAHAYGEPGGEERRPVTHLRATAEKLHVPEARKVLLAAELRADGRIAPGASGGPLVMRWANEEVMFGMTVEGGRADPIFAAMARLEPWLPTPENGGRWVDIERGGSDFDAHRARMVDLLKTESEEFQKQLAIRAGCDTSQPERVIDRLLELEPIDAALRPIKLAKKACATGTVPAQLALLRLPPGYGHRSLRAVDVCGHPVIVEFWAAADEGRAASILRDKATDPRGSSQMPTLPRSSTNALHDFAKVAEVFRERFFRASGSDDVIAFMQARVDGRRRDYELLRETGAHPEELADEAPYFCSVPDEAVPELVAKLRKIGVKVYPFVEPGSDEKHEATVLIQLIEDILDPRKDGV